MLLSGPGWVWPVPIAADGRKPRISDGFHRAGDMSVRGGVGHRGQDVMFRKVFPTAPKLPWSSRWFEMLPNTPVVCAQEGAVFRLGQLETGWHVVVEHGHDVGTAYYHLSSLIPGLQVGSMVHPGQPLGVVGFSPTGYQLAHLHFDLAIKGKFQDAANAMRSWGYVTLEQAWGRHGRVG